MKTKQHQSEDFTFALERLELGSRTHVIEQALICRGLSAGLAADLLAQVQQWHCHIQQQRAVRTVYLGMLALLIAMSLLGLRLSGFALPFSDVLSLALTIVGVAQTLSGIKQKSQLNHYVKE